MDNMNLGGIAGYCERRGEVADVTPSFMMRQRAMTEGQADLAEPSVDLEPLTLLVVDDEELVHLKLDDYLESLGHRVVHAYSGLTGLAELERRRFDIVMVDIGMLGMDGMSLLRREIAICSRTPFVLMSANSNIDLALNGLRRGAAEYLVKPIKFDELALVLAKARRYGALVNDGIRLRRTINRIQGGLWRSHCFFNLLGESSAIIRLREQIAEAAHSRSDTILVAGEPGAGKEVVARAIHMVGDGTHPFIPISCFSTSDDQMILSLLGEVADTSDGKSEGVAGGFEMAEGGTLFLDGVGNLSLSVQAELQRAIETRTFRRVGGERDIAFSLRLIASTDRDLEERVRNGTFRPDLYRCLNICNIYVPPLRERREDIAPLARHFLSILANESACRCGGLTLAAEGVLNTCDFLGNVRELRNCIECACIACRKQDGRKALDAQHLTCLDKCCECDHADVPEAEDPSGIRTRILKELNECKWNRRMTARELDMPYSTLLYKLKQLGLD